MRLEYNETTEGWEDSAMENPVHEEAAERDRNRVQSLVSGLMVIKAFDAIRNDQGGDKILQRTDIAQMYQASSQLASASGKP